MVPDYSVFTNCMSVYVYEIWVKFKYPGSIGGRMFSAQREQPGQSQERPSCGPRAAVL